MTYVNFKDGPKLVSKETPLVAPARAMYTLNGQMFTTQILNKLGAIDTNQLSVNLLCGNETKLPLNLKTSQFE